MLWDAWPAGPKLASWTRPDRNTQNKQIPVKPLSFGRRGRLKRRAIDVWASGFTSAGDCTAFSSAKSAGKVIVGMSIRYRISKLGDCTLISTVLEPLSFGCTY